jgi:hypothetical protein
LTTLDVSGLEVTLHTHYTFSGDVQQNLLGKCDLAEARPRGEPSRCQLHSLQRMTFDQAL